jgi:hypothetical protein
MPMPMPCILLRHGPVAVTGAATRRSAMVAAGGVEPDM